jgi:magnesium chelatase subunit D
VEVARARLGTLAVGGGTPLADGLRTVADAVAPALAGADFAPVLVLITDGRATVGAGGDPVDDARTQARSLARLGLRAVVVDAEQGIPRLGLARTLAGDLGAELVDLDGLRAADVAAAVRRQVEA